MWIIVCYCYILFAIVSYCWLLLVIVSHRRFLLLIMTIPTYRYFYCDNDSSNVIDIVVWLWHGYCCDIFQKKPGCPKAGAASNQSVCQRLNWNPSGQILYPSLGLPPRGICHISTSNSFLLLFVPPMLQNTRVPNVAWSKHIYIYIHCRLFSHKRGLSSIHSDWDLHAHYVWIFKMEILLVVYQLYIN